jgi:hypothetical protein
LQTDLDVFHDCGTISHLLQAIIAADYLGLEKGSFTGFENYVIERLAVVLLQDRRKLIPTYLDLVETHCAFRNKKIWRFFGKAGVRPFLQEFMKEGPDKETDFGAITSRDTIPRRGHPQQEAWLEILRHCAELRKCNKAYALEVTEQVSSTLQLGRRWESGKHFKKGPVVYEDPVLGGENSLLIFECGNCMGIDLDDYKHFTI